MFINKLEISHFRGIKEGDILFPQDSRIICMIGAGDSTKSTILKAIEWIFWPSWNLIVCDNDFYNCDTTTPIVLRGTFSEFPEKMMAEDKFGMYLRKSNPEYGENIDDEPIDGESACLTIQLTIDNTLEPKWEIVCNRKEARAISHIDRKALAVGSIGNNCAKDMVWGKFSVLQKYADAKGLLHDAYTVALREAANQANFSQLDDIGETLTSVGEQYGVNFESQIKNKMIVQNGSFSSTVGLFDGDIPLSQKGTGTQKLLSMGLNILATEGSALLLVDEVENGLEPYRLRSLLNEFRDTHTDIGQVIMTTHSPIAVAECTIGELLIVQSQNGKTDVFRLKSDDSDLNASLQAEIRRNAEAFLCKRLIICEGKTEIGFIRALDAYLAKTKKYRLAFKGVGTADGCGSQIFDCAKTLRSCGYGVCLLMDSDLPEEEEQKEDLLWDEVSIFDWETPNALEEQIFYDVPTEVATKIIKIVVDEYGVNSVKAKLKSQNIAFETEKDEIRLEFMEPEIQKKIGTIAKNKNTHWFKRIDRGELLGNIIFNNWKYINDEAKLKVVVENLIKWVVDND